MRIHPGRVNTAAIIISRQRETEVRERAEEALRASLADRDAFLRELHHRVKNNLQVVTSLLEMQGRQAADPAAVSLLSDARDRITAIAAIHELLYQSGSFSEVDLSAYARRLVRHVVSLYDRSGRIEVSVVGDDIRIDLASAVPFGLLLNELVSNVCKHAFPSHTAGALRVALHRDNGHLRMQVTDNGVGLPNGFSDRMPGTLGLQLVHMLAKQLGGTVRFDCGVETSVEVRAPMQGETA
jgi:two-component sensor histidine kinase